jgi:hypothetical protein
MHASFCATIGQIEIDAPKQRLVRSGRYAQAWQTSEKLNILPQTRAAAIFGSMIFLLVFICL